MNAIEIACHTITWERHRFEQALADISELGYTGFETFGLQRFYGKEAEFKALLHRRGLKFSAAYYGGSFVDAGYIQLEIQKIQLALEFVKEIGAGHIVLGGGRVKPEGICEDDYKILAESLNKVGEQASKVGVRMCYHPHAGTLVESREQIEKICELTDPNMVYLAPDTAHLALGGCDPVEVFRTYISRIEYMHFKDLRDGKFVELGQGTIDFPSVYQVLKDHDYSGWITVELDTTERTPRDSAQISKKYLSDKLGL
jgi:inosose dehydratase